MTFRIPLNRFPNGDATTWASMLRDVFVIEVKAVVVGVSTDPVDVSTEQGVRYVARTLDAEVAIMDVQSVKRLTDAQPLEVADE